MLSPQRPIFREEALKQYMRKQEKDVLPRFISPPVFLCIWALLFLCIIAIFLAWWTQIPFFVNGPGIVQAADTSARENNHTAIVFVFLPATDARSVHAGLPVQLQVTSAGPRFPGTIASVTSAPLSPDDIRKRYALGDAASQLPSQPAIVLIVKPEVALSYQTYAGSLVSARIQVGSQRVLSLLPQVGNLIGG